MPEVQPKDDADVVVRLEAVSVVRKGVVILGPVDFTVKGGDRWVLLGPNGAGKTTLLSVMGMRLLPTKGTVDVLGERAGRTDTRELRKRVAFVSQSLLRQLRPTMTAYEAVISGRYAALETWWNEYSTEDAELATQLLESAGLKNHHERAFGLLSEGERQQVLLARALMSEPELLLLDEPAAGLDLAARERLVDRLSKLATDPTTPPFVLITHHTEEIPPAMTHAALMKSGEIISSGAIGEAITDDALSSCFGVEVEVERVGERWFARSVG
ncbi:MAG: ATP-binding cassette domain-containing protein [Acidimicrobiales bacterium]